MKENKAENKFDPRCHIGETHGIYTIVDMLNEKDKYGHWIYVGECKECGYKKYSHYGGFARKDRNATSCKHLTLGTNKNVPITKWEDGRISRVYQKMKQRCYNEHNKDYKWYGAKGIKICDEWLYNPKSFEEWALKNGYKNNLTIDRIDQNKDYSSNNCRWIPLIENSRRAGIVNWITIDKETLTGRQWATRLGLGSLTIDKYIKRYGLETTKKLMIEMIKSPPSTKYRKPKQTWFSVYNIF